MLFMGVEKMQFDDGDFLSTVEDVILPYWLHNGFDPVTGQFEERLSSSGGEIRSVPRRLMVQSRQIYVFSEAENARIISHSGDVAVNAMENILKIYCPDHDYRRGFAYSADRDGIIVSGFREAYTHAFVLFALASIYRLTNDRRYINIAEQVDSFITENLLDKLYGGLYTSASKEMDHKLQNPMMHLLEAYLSLAAAGGGEVYIRKSECIIKFFEDTIYDSKKGGFPEIFSHDWAPHPKHDLANTYEPGHHFEWLWLLSRYDSMTGSHHSELIEGLWGAGCKGLSPEGHCYDLIDFDGRIVRSSMRLWPHTEGVRAASLRIGYDASAMRTIANLLSTIGGVFLRRPFAAGWIDHFDASRAPLVDYVPASSLYHIYGAYVELRSQTRGKLMVTAALETGAK